MEGRATVRRLTARRTCLLALIWVVGCGRNEAAPTPRVVDTQADFILALGDAGAWVARSGDAAPGLFGVTGETLTVSGIPIEVYEYPSPVERERVSLTISPDGSAIAGQPAAWRAAPHVWAAGSILVVYQGTDGPMILLLDAVLGDPLAQGGGVGTEPYPPAVTAAIGELAQSLQIDPAVIEVVSFEEQVWPDGCLGLAAPDEMCTMQEVSGWRIVLRAQGHDYAARTDESGGTVRLE
ncbi:MAG: hypothetical protein WD906_08875 [Anaerolineales bacterium]